MPERLQSTEPPVQAQAFDIDWALSVLRRQKWLIAACILGGLGLGAAYVSTTTPTYTAGVRLLIDPALPPGMSSGQQQGQREGLDSSLVDSQVEVLRSGNIASNVVTSLNLADDPVFAADTRGMLAVAIGELRNLLRGGGGSSDVDEEELAKRAAVRRLMSNLSVVRVENTYVIALDYVSPSAPLSARIANAFAETYMADRFQVTVANAENAGRWLREQLDQVRKQVLDSDLEIQKFRTENNLITAGGTLIGEQQLSELASQLILARAERSQAEARWRGVASLSDEERVRAALPEALSNPIILELRQRYLAASKNLAEVSTAFGADHGQAQRLRNEMNQYERLIGEEVSRIASSYESDYQVAVAREASLQADLTRLEDQLAKSNELQVSLRQLEREADTSRDLYRSLLERRQEAMQQQTFPTSEARVITPAEVPERATHPRKAFIMVLSLLAGAAVGVGLGFLREFGRLNRAA